METSEIIKCKKAFWPVQPYAFEKRANRIFIAHIIKGGQYEILFNHPETLRVKHLNILILNSFIQFRFFF